MDPQLLGRLDPSDVLQEAFLDASRRFAEYLTSPSVPLSLWLRSLTLQRLVDLHRQHLGAKKRDVGREVSGGVFDVPETSAIGLANLLVDSTRSPTSEVIHREKCRRVREAVESLAPLDREVLAMRHFEELSNSDVARILQISVTAASNRYVRAVSRLKEVLDSLTDPNA
ncbi:MAG TPA: sigma-70 family RNA polymerase sigma factor [Pirellulales bacterium]|nr:sigma-70 family RNA polymerase sigma factor [Pirellulales bacterium]